MLQGDEGDEDPDKLKPYKTDLEYLDDHFQVAQCTIPQVTIEDNIPVYLLHSCTHNNLCVAHSLQAESERNGLQD